MLKVVFFLELLLHLTVFSVFLAGFVSVVPQEKGGGCFYAFSSANTRETESGTAGA